MRLSSLYWPIVSMGLWVLACWLAAGPGERAPFPLDRQQFLVFVVVGSAGAIIAAALRIMARGGWRTLRHSTVWCLVLFTAFLGYESRFDLSQLYMTVRGTIQPSVALSRAQGEAELRRNWDGHYRAEAQINGVNVRMLVDTGASMVLLPYEIVHRLGIDPAKLDYSLPVITANGKSTVAPVMLSSIKVGPIAVFNVEAAVAHPGKLKTPLLGMSFLDELTETSFQRGRLILRN